MHPIIRTVMGTALAGISAVALTLPAATFAAAAAPPADPAVARISDLAGPVDVHRADVDDTYAAALNAPVAAGDYLETQNGGRAEVEFDHATVLRVAPQTQTRFTHLTPDVHEVQLAQGTVELRLFRGTGGNPDVQTPGAEVRPRANGRYRVTVDAHGNTVVAVRDGEAVVTTSGGDSRTLGPGATVAIEGSGRDAHPRGWGRPAYDAFDGWCDGRDRGWSRVTDWDYIDAGMVGENDLMQYGTWNDDANYGESWVPSDEPSSWSPYSDGRFVWAADYGWTWVGNEPWGYAPYHYGRWFRNRDNRWAWAPGRSEAGNTYAYAPAVVGFFGLGSGIGLGFALGDVGWVPLAPGDAFVPWWGPGYGDPPYGRRFPNESLAHYRNARYAGALVVVTGRDFAAGRFTHVEHVPAARLRNAVAFRGAIPVVPTSRNLAFDGRDLAPRRAQPLSARFARMGGAPARTVAFERERSDAANAARSEHPAFAASVEHQAAAPGRGAGFAAAAVAAGAGAYAATHALHANAAHAETKAHAPAIDHPAYAQPHPATAWDRFGTKPKTAIHADVAPHAAAHDAAGTHGYATPHTATRETTLTHAPTHAYAAPRVATPADKAPAVTHVYTTPVTPHTYKAPVVPHTYTAPVVPHTYTAPRHTYVAPVAPHVAPVVPPPHPAPPHPAAAPADDGPHHQRGH